MPIIAMILIGGVLLWLLHQQWTDYYNELDPIVVNLRTKLSPVFPEMNKVRVMKGDSSYTISKKKIYLCTEQNGKIYDDNMLTYVLLHELAHTINIFRGHGSEFRRIFDSLLKRATRHGLYDPNIPRVENYCKTS